MYHLEGIELHRAPEPLAHIGLSVLDYSCWVGSCGYIILEAKHTAVHAASWAHVMSLLQEAKGQCRNDTQRVHTDKAPSSLHLTYLLIG